MKTIQSIITESGCTSQRITRLKYEPYSFDLAKKMWHSIAREIAGTEIDITEPVGKLWGELIKYVHTDDSFQFDSTKAIGLIGQTGTGKTFAMNIMNAYSGIDEVKYLRGDKVVKFRYKIVSARELVAAYSKSGYDGLLKFMMMANLCIDDIGSEELESNYYGTKLRVINEMIEERYRRGLMTHFTANLTESQIEDIYDSRVYSRLRHTTNIMFLNTKDFRLNP